MNHVISYQSIGILQLICDLAEHISSTFIHALILFDLSQQIQTVIQKFDSNLLSCTVSVTGYQHVILEQRKNITFEPLDIPACLLCCLLRIVLLSLVVGLGSIIHTVQHVLSTVAC